jgi:1-acyl-sn-glycerol-3-phosphate acyltransferase
MGSADRSNVKLKEQVYLDDRPAEYFDRFHDRARNKKPNVVYEIVRILTSMIGWILYRARSISPDKVPDGPVILAPNHFSNLDHFFAGMAVRRHVRFMAKSQLFKPPMQWVYTNGGVFPVRRGHADAEVFITAEKILADGGCVLMYCEGGRSRTGDIGSEAKRGIGKLALETGVPIVPVAIHGSSKVRNWKRFELPKVTIQYGDAIQWDRIDDPTREQQQAVADEVLVRIRAVYAGLESEGRKGAVKRAREERRGSGTAVAGQSAS